MRGNTITFNLNGQRVRRSTKHVKIGRKAYSSANKWDALLDIAFNTEENLKKFKGKR